MRAAMGAARLRLIQLSLSESLFLGVAGGASGVLLAWGLLKALVKMSPSAFLRLNQVGIDLRVLVFAFVTSLLAVVLFGAAAALRRPRAEELAGWHVLGLGHGRFRQALVAFQIAISLVLLTGSSLFVRSLLKLESQQLGMQTQRVITVSFLLDSHRYPQAAAQNAFYRALETRLAAIPGIATSGLSEHSSAERSHAWAAVLKYAHCRASSAAGARRHRCVSICFPGIFRRFTNSDNCRTAVP